MTIRKIDEIVKLTSHPMEKFLDIDENSTEMVVTKRNTELLPYEQFDDKDKEIETDYQIVMDSALDIVDRVTGIMDKGAVEPKHIARLTEVVGQHLTIALSAAEKKAKLKENRDRLELRKTQKSGNGANITNFNIITDRNSLLKHLRQTVEGEYAVIENEQNDNKKE